MYVTNRLSVQACPRSQQTTSVSVHNNTLSLLHASSVATHHVRIANAVWQPHSCLAVHAQEYTLQPQQGLLTIPGQILLITSLQMLNQ